jgi:hypothetical protein
LGVLLIPSPYGRIFVSFSYTDGILDEMESAWRLAARVIAQ